MSAVELLRNHLDQLNTAKRQELFEDIFSSTQHMAGLMEQVLVLGRVEAGKLAFRPTSLNLFALCEKLVDESLSATNRRCPIQLTFDDTSAVTSTDESLLRHILTNLLSNAVKYSPPGAPVELTGRHEGPNTVLTIRDHGIGIPEADLPKLFEAFHRAPNVGDIQGTGLGLVIVKRCVDLHGGTIEVTSNVGEGTSFIVRLPVATS
jgi:signal transduction histidine kinase